MPTGTGGATRTGASVAARLDRLPVGRVHRWATFVIGLGLFFDAYENFLAATISEVLQTQLSLSTTAAAMAVLVVDVAVLGHRSTGRSADAA